MSSVVPFNIQFAILIKKIRQLLLSDPSKAYLAAKNLKKLAAAQTFGNDVIANLQRFNMIDKARQLETECKLAIAASGGMVPTPPDDDDDQNAQVIPFPIKP